MKRILPLVLSIALVLSVLPAHAEVAPSELDAYINRRFSSRRIPCGAVVIAQNGQTVFELYYGAINSLKTVKATKDTLFRVASVTKLVSAVGLMQQFEQGKFSLDAPVADILPFPVSNPNYPDTPITPRQTLSHTSSFAQKNYYRFSWEKLKPGSSYFLKKTKPGEQYQYSNINGGLTGSMIEALSGQSIFTYMEEHVFAPLQITATYAPNMLESTDNIAFVFKKNGKNYFAPNYYVRDSAKYKDEAAPREHLAITVGNLFITAPGLSALMNALLLGGETNGVRLLNADTVWLMEQEQNKLPGSSVSAQSKYGLGLARVNDLPGGVWYGHQGMKEGLTADAFYQKETALSVVVIANGYSAKSENGTVNIAREIMTLATDYAQRGLWAEYAQLQKQAE